VADIVPLFRAHQRANNPVTDRTWAMSWQRLLDKLPQDELITARLLTDAVKATPENQTRKSACRVYGALAAYAKIPVDFSELSKKQRSERSQKEIPSDAILFAARDQLTSRTVQGGAGWKWVYSVMLLAGLRPHEAFFCQWSNAGLEVTQGKTGARTIFYEAFELLYPGLIEEWGLKDIRLPKVDAQRAYEKGNLGYKVWARWKTWGLPFKPYDLRHAFAIRASVTHGINTATAAALMGHSEEVHIRVYHAWLSKSHNQAVLKAALEKQAK
jgi:integrase